VAESIVMIRVVLVSVLVVGCTHTNLAVQYDVTRRAGGEVATGQPRDGAPSGSIGFGVGTRAASLGLIARGRDISLDDDPWLAGELALDLQVAPVRRGPAAAYLHGGPVRALLYDVDARAAHWGVGLTYGLGLKVGFGGVHLVSDVTWTELRYTGAMPTTSGAASLRTASVGLQFGQ
jgi:hypothetical protein